MLRGKGIKGMDEDTTATSPSKSATKPLSIKIKDNPLPNTSTSTSPSPSPYNSPPSSAFVSALQSPYISPRAITPPSQDNATPPSEDLPSTSYTPPSDQYEFSDPCPTTCNIPLSVPARVSFSFPVPRISFAKGSVSPASSNSANANANANAKLRSCDVYVGFHGHNPNLLRFCKWLKSELELQGIACFVADRAKYSDSQSHEIADRVICSVTYGVVLVTASTLLNRLTLEEIRFFAQKKNLVPVFFEPEVAQSLLGYTTTSADRERKEAIDALLRCNEFKLGADGGNWRQCISRAAGILRAKLGRKSVAGEADALDGCFEELPFPRNRFFVGRDKEISEMEAALFGCCGGGLGDCLDHHHLASSIGEASGQSEGFADEESDVVVARSFVNLEMGKCNEPNLEAWIEGRCPTTARRAKYKKSAKSGGGSVICINGVAGIGKTELALEFAYRYSQRYKMVLWVGGEARYLRQNILNLSLNLGLDVSADPERERGRIRSFDEQEFEAFKRVKRELFRDMPYLLIIDNLETGREWWEGKDLHDLIPRNTGGSHVIITSRLSKVMNFDTMQLLPLPLKDAMVLIRGRRKRDYPAAQDLDFLKLFDEKLARLTFGLWLVGSLLSELAISPSALFEAVNQVHLDEPSASGPCLIGIDEEQYCKNNPFLMKLLSFCFVVLQQANGRPVNRLVSRMVLVGAWFAPSPVSASLLGVAAENMSTARNCYLRRWTKCLPSASLLLGCCTSCLAAKNWKSEEDSALLLVKLGLARRANHKQHQTAGCWIQFHPITQIFAKRNQLGLQAAKATVDGIRKIGNPLANSDHLWASAFLVFGFKSEPPMVQLKAIDMVLYIRRTALPLAIRAFTTFSRCNSALELLKVCTNVLEEVEKSFVSQIQDWYCHGSLCWKKKKKTTKTTTTTSNQTMRVDEYVWQDVTLLKATLLETRAKLLLRGGHFDSGEELCRTCISIRTVMLGHNHTHTLAAQETLAKLVRMRSKI